ncbi:hypothetical protein BH10ACT11_BH10ACT11_08830 [soil metagenome]
MRSGLSALLIALVLAISACGGDSDSSSTSTDSSAADSAGNDASSPCQSVKQPAPKKAKLKAPSSKPPPDGSTVTFDTSFGGFTVALDTKNDPKTTASVAYLVKQGLYDDTTIVRVAPGFVIQCGDPAGDGTGGPGYSVTEKPPADTAYTKGVVAMAKTEVEPPGTSGSQFFVVSGADAGLPPDYAVMGKVTAGFDTVHAIESQASSQDGPPSIPIVINKATLDEG